MTTLGAEGIAESLSLAKEQPHRATPAELPQQAEYYFVLMKWPGPGQEKLTFRAQLTFLPSLQNPSSEKAKGII